MLSTLAERLADAMAGPPKVTSVALARACGVKAPSVSDWLSGKSKSMDGSNLIDAAEFLGVGAKWLIKGIGPKRLNPYTPAVMAAEPRLDYDAWTAEATRIVQGLDDADRRAAVINLRTFVRQIGPPRDGQALPVAEKKRGNGA